MLKRIIGVIGVSLWAGLIVFAVVMKLSCGGVEPAEKAVQGVSDIESAAKDLVNALADGDYKKATENFNETMKKVMSEERLRQVWNSLIVRSGAFVRQVESRKEKAKGYDVVLVTCKFEKTSVDARVVFDKYNRVAGLFFIPSRRADR